MAWVMSYLVFDRLDIALLDGIEDIGEAAQLLDRQGRAGFFLGDGGKIEAQHHAGHEADENQSELLQLATHGNLDGKRYGQSICGALSHFKGSNARP